MRTIPTPLWLWPLLAVPALIISIDLAAATDPRAFRAAVHPSGEWAARLLIVTMMATPLVMMLRNWRGPRWLMRHRRAFGVAAFGYSLLHLVIYLLSRGDLARVVADLDRMVIWTGWLAFAVMLPPAIASNDRAVRWLGQAWKPVQRLTYGAALLTLWHWAVIHNWGGTVPALLHFAPLACLTAYRVWWNWLRERPAQVGA